MPSHAINFADQTDNILVMKKGEIVREGSFENIFLSEEFQEIYNLEKKKKVDKKEDEEEEKILNELKLQKEATKSLEKMDENHEQVSDTEKAIEHLIIPEDR